MKETLAAPKAHCRLRHSAGLSHIAHLLSHPNQRLHVLDLVQRAPASGQGAAFAVTIRPDRSIRQMGHLPR